MNPKNIKKMQKPMEDEGYAYCEKHDIYYDEWLTCPACILEDMYIELEDIYTLKDRIRDVVKRFNPKDRF